MQCRCCVGKQAVWTHLGGRTLEKGAVVCTTSVAEWSLRCGAEHFAYSSIFMSVVLMGQVIPRDSGSWIGKVGVEALLSDE